MASAAEVARALPGDELIPDANVVMDRVLHLPAPPDQVWPWLVQLGKRRAGWYFPRGLERVIPRRRRATRSIDPRWQGLVVGDRIPDWGPGDPSFEAVAVDPPTALVYLSLRQKSRGHRWPEPGHEDDPDVMAFSWALVLSPTTGVGLAGSEVAGSEVAGSEVAGSEVAGSEVAGSEVAGSEVAGSEVAGSEVAGSDATWDGAAGSPAGVFLGGSGAGGTRVHIRLRIRRSARPRPWSPLLMAAGRTLDWGTIALLDRGLTERLTLYETRPDH